MTRLNTIRLAAVGTLIGLALPAVSYASEPGPVITRPASDTLSKLDKAKTERQPSGSAPKKKLKTRQASPAQPHANYGPDQPWETEFYVENDIAGRREIQLALASFERRR